MNMSGPSVTVSASTTTTKVSPNIRFDKDILRSIPGILKISQIAVSLIGFICVQCIRYAQYESAGGWYIFVAMTGFWVTLIVLIAYLFHIVEKLHWLPWLLSETVFAAVWSVFFFIAACVAAAHASGDPAWGAASFFGFAAMILFGWEAFFKFKSWRTGDIAQGERVTTSNTNTNIPTPTGPSYPTY